jgi:hypothetical protein
MLIFREQKTVEGTILCALQIYPNTFKTEFTVVWGVQYNPFANLDFVTSASISIYVFI